MKRLRSKAGAMLIEVMAAVGIFAVMALGLTANTIAVIKANVISKKTAAASALAHDKIEFLRALDPATDPPDITAGTHNDPLNPMDPLGRNGGKFYRQWVVERDTPDLGLSTVEVRVRWTTPLPGAITAVTYICQTGTCS